MKEVVDIKLRFYTKSQIPTVALENSEGIEEDSWINDLPTVFIYSLDPNGLCYNAIKIVFDAIKNVFYCNGLEKKHLDIFEIFDNDDIIIYKHFDENDLCYRNFQ